jgi:plasmid stabilization system protein ParE
MARVNWSPDAVRDVEGICQNIERSSPQYARVFAPEVLALGEAIAQQPHLGGVVPEYEQEDLRERLLQSYRVIYRIRGEDVEVVTVVHGARRLPRTPPP